MSLSKEQHEELETILQTLDAERAELNDNSRKFLDDQIARHEQYGDQIRLSPKQWDWLRSLYEKVTK